MIDHVSIGVRDLDASARFYEAVLATIGFAKLVERPNTVGFGKAFAEFWLNSRPNMNALDADSGVHMCLRARSSDLVDTFWQVALSAGGTDVGAPGLRPQHGDNYYSAFIRDPDGNRVEVVTFLEKGDET